MRFPLPKLRVLSGAEVRSILESHGFVFVRRRGSHMIMQRVTSEGTIGVTVPDHKELRTGTLCAIISDSKLGREPFQT